MPQVIPDNTIANKLMRYFSLQHSVLKELISLGTMPLASYHILYLLDKHGKMRMGDIAEIMAVSRPNLTPLADKLASLQYITRGAYDHDRRIICIAITDAGREALKNEIESAVRCLSGRARTLTDDDFERFIAASNIITELLKKQ